MTFKIHPAIGIARLGDSTSSFYIAPEGPGVFPIDCDANGNPVTDAAGVEQTVTTFKDPQGRVKRQAARFRVYAYDGDGDPGHELSVGDTIEVVKALSGTLISGTVLDVEWTVYLANKKASWYEFQELEGEHGYAASHKLRNADVTDADARNSLIIDPGPQTVLATGADSARAHFAAGRNPDYTQTFPPPLQPRSIETLGELMATQSNGHARLLVLGGHGNSGSYKTGFGQPVITAYANNDGWFDDVSDGPVLARIKYQPVTEDGRPLPADTKPMYANVDVGAWVIVGYPRYAPQITDMVTMDDIVYDIAVRQFGHDTAMFNVAPFDAPAPPPDPTDTRALVEWRRRARWNPNYHPGFNSEIWPILQRPFNYQWVMDADPTTGGDPHDTTPGMGGNFDPQILSTPPFAGEPEEARAERRAARMFLWNVLRKAGQENIANDTVGPAGAESLLWLMPLLCGDNPLSNTTPSKFLRLTDTQLFLLGQWANGLFVNEDQEHFAPASGAAALPSGADLDRGVLANVLGGSFCPGAEASWIMRNPAIYAGPYRINLHPRMALNSLVSNARDPLAGAGDGPLGNNVQPLSTAGDIASGLEPGDLTKYSAVPWQADFNECTSQAIDITYDTWNKLALDTTNDPAIPLTKAAFWWPAHRPMIVGGANWSQGIPDSNQGDLKMVTAWKDLGFVVVTGSGADQQAKQVERNGQ